ncbi:hypothetical protein N2152v2_002109 [Parachlorella kessleri]
MALTVPHSTTAYSLVELFDAAHEAAVGQVTIGFPPAVEVYGGIARNPCVYKVERLAGFLARYTPGRRFTAQQQHAGDLGPARSLHFICWVVSWLASAPGAAAAAQVVASRPNQPEASQEGAASAQPDCVELSVSRATCVICQELVVRCVSTSCDHNFCGECLARWLVNKRECPTCRAEVLEVPTWNTEIDALCNGALEQQLSAEDFEERQRRKRAVENSRQQMEAVLRAPWQPRARSSSTSSSRAASEPEDSRVGPGRAPGGSSSGRTPGNSSSNRRDGAASVQAAALGPARAVAGSDSRGRDWLRLLLVLLVLGRVVVLPPLGCLAVQGQGPKFRFPCYVVRFGAESRPNSGAGPQDQSSTAWYHLKCVPQHYWRQSLFSGIFNMRGVNRADELRIKRLQRQAV